jgi:hypothetical protein
MKIAATKIKAGDTVTYCGATFVAKRVSLDERSGLVKVEVEEGITQFIAPEREVEIAPTEDVYEVVQDSDEIACDHPACATMHRRLHNERYDRPEQEWVTNLRTGEEKQVTVETYHMLTRKYWVVLRNGVKVADTYHTKREALAEAARKPTH